MKSLAEIDPRQFDGKIMTPGEIQGWFECVGEAIWHHDGNPQNPHVELVSGLHSNGFINCGEVLSYPNIADILARQLFRKITEEGIEKVDWVIGSAYGSIIISQKIAELFNARHGFPDKDPTDLSSKRMLWRRFEIPKNARVLRIEELITVLWSLRELTSAVERGNPNPVNFLPFVGTLVHRPPKLPVDYRNIEVVSLLEMEMWAVYKEDCPLCKVGSIPIRPKGRWKELIGRA